MVVLELAYLIGSLYAFCFIFSVSLLKYPSKDNLFKEFIKALILSMLSWITVLYLVLTKKVLDI